MNLDNLKKGDWITIEGPTDSYFIEHKWYEIVLVPRKGCWEVVDEEGSNHRITSSLITAVQAETVEELHKNPSDFVKVEILSVQGNKDMFKAPKEEEDPNLTQYAQITDKVSAITTLKALMFDSIVVEDVPLIGETYQCDYEELQVLVKLLEGTEFVTKIKAHIYDYRESDFDESLWCLGLNGLEASDILDVLQGE